MSFIAENYVPPVFLCPVFVFESFFVAFCLHCFCKEVLFNRGGMLFSQPPRGAYELLRSSFLLLSPRLVFMASLVFLGSSILFRIRQALSLGVASLLPTNFPLRFEVTDPVSFFIFATRLMVDILTHTIFDISL